MLKTHTQNNMDRFDNSMLSGIRQKRQEPYDLTHVWDIKLKVTTKENKQKLTDTDNSVVVTRGRGWRGSKE